MCNRKTILILFISLSQICVAQKFKISHGQSVNIYVEKTESPVVHTAMEMVSADLVEALDADMTQCDDAKEADVVCSYDTTMSRESFELCVRRGRLYVKASDAHGMAYGLLELSRLAGVSPWEWWADCHVRKIKSLSLRDGYRRTESPAVAYRGIFINDEDWGMIPWSTRREPSAWTIKQGRIKGAVGPETTEKIFQLLLRLRANYYWPPMHECTQPFFLTEGNREVAAKYGIYIGGSHCEPMACSAAAEWGLRGTGDYNYVSNEDGVRKFWQERLDEVKNQEILYTIGMRGVHDGAMQGVKTMDEKVRTLQKVINDQREMFENTKPGMADGKQLFVPYKEVLDIYKSGLHVPEDVTLMWTDDNYGYIRHYPDSTERARKGGNGLYYHVSYWGAPQDYLWLASFSPRLMYHQMREAYRRGMQQVWVLNVGDIKPAEFLLEEWMSLAWDGFTDKKDEVGDMMRSFYAREFGDGNADNIVRMMDEWYALASERRPEFMANTRVYENDRQWWAKHRTIPGWNNEDVRRRVEAYQRLSDEAEKIDARIPSDRKYAYYQLVKYPVQAAAQMNFKFLCPERRGESYDSIVVLTELYNKGYDGKCKWQGMMDMSPRKLPVFDKVDTLLTYPAPTEKMLSVMSRCKTTDNGDLLFKLPKDAVVNDSVTLEISVLPTFPVYGDRMAMSISSDGCAGVVAEFQSKYHGEEWKQNVLRNRAVRRVKIPTRGGKVLLSMLDEGITVIDIKIKIRDGK